MLLTRKCLFGLIRMFDLRASALILIQMALMPLRKQREVQQEAISSICGASFLDGLVTQTAKCEMLRLHGHQKMFCQIQIQDSL